MKPISHVAILAVLFTPLASVHASSTAADSVHFCLPVDPEQRQRNDPLSAGKWATDLDVGEPRTVRLFYFLPNDRPYRTEVVDSMKTGILDLQTFFGEQMEAHGHGNTTFQIETDDQGDPVVHRVDGDYTDSHYSSRGYTEGEIKRAFDNSKNIMLIVMDVSARTAHGRGTGSKSSGWAMIYGEWNWFAAAHELGHAFGLHHDFRDDTYIMSYGRANRSAAQLSACAADFLSAHPYFDSDVPLENESPPTVELVASEFPFGSVSTTVQLRVRDDDGLHQVILFVRPRNPFLGSTPEVKACDGLSGETDTVVEFNFDGRLPSDNVGTSPEAHTTLANTVRHPIHVVAVDTDGNRTSTASPISFTLEAGHSPQHIATLDRYRTIQSAAFSPDGNILALGGHGHIELLQASTREHLAFLSHSIYNEVYSVAFSPDGTLLASGSEDGTIKTWNVATREEVSTLEGHTDRIWSVDFSADGMLLASGASDNSVKLWNVATGAQSATLEGHTDAVLSVSFLSDGTLASKSNGGTVKLWDVTTQSQISTFDTDANIGRGVAFSPNGPFLASRSRYAIKLWDLETGTQTGSLNHMRDYPWATLAFSPDGTILAVSANGLIEIWDVLTSEFLASISGGPGGVGELLFSPDGTQLVSTGKVKFWDVSEWTASQTTVCDRTPQVQTAILGVLQLQNPSPGTCGEVTEAHLATGITSLFLNDQSVTALQAGDFDGLTSLTELRLNGNQLTTLPADVFDGLTALTKIDLGFNDLSSLPEGVFDGLTALGELSLGGNDLSSLPEDAFDGLTALTTLNLGDNDLSSLPEDVFDGLTALSGLYLGGNDLSSLPEDVFDGLTALTTLDLAYNDLRSLPEDVFDGLTALASLYLSSNDLSSLPDGVFVGLTELASLSLGGNTVNPLPLTISLEKVGDDQFKAVAPAGAPFEMVLPIRVTNGSITGGATSITIPAGSVESEVLTVTRTSGNVWSVTVDIGAVPGLPANHSGYSLVKSDNLPLEVIKGLADGPVIWSGTITVGSWRNGTYTAFGYSRRHNAGSISNATFTYRGTTYTIHGFGFAKLGHHRTQTYTLEISPGLPACDRKLLSFGGFHLADASRGSLGDPSSYRWSGRPLVVWPIGQQRSYSITFHPTVPDVPVVTAIYEGNQVTLSWETPCDGGIDINRHEYRQKNRNSEFGSWIPIPNSGAGGVNVASYTLTGVNNPQEHIFEVRAVNELGEGSVSAPASPTDRTPQVAEAILSAVRQNDPSVSSFADITDSHLAAITALYLGGRNITSLKSGDFAGLTGLTDLRLRGNQISSLPGDIFDGLPALTTLYLRNIRLSSLPAGLFEGLTGLTTLYLEGNAVSPLPFAVSLEKVGTGQFNAVAPAGAPFNIVLPLTVTNGSISGGATTITIAKGSVESQPLTVTPTPGTTAPVTVNIGTLPSIPSGHYGYTLVKSADLPLEIFSSSETGTTSAATDFNGDGRTDFVDFFLFADAYGGTDPRFDLDGNGTVDFADFFKFVDAFGS